jgi:hypothetical protein
VNPAFLGVYLLFAFLVSLMGHERRIGVLGFFILALLLTPPVMLLIAVVTRPKARVR